MRGFRTPSRAGLLACLILAATTLIGGCALPKKVAGTNDLKTERWAGRISLQVQTDPMQSFSASFELKGQPDQGELALISPLGNTLGVLRWSPAEALLDSGGGKIQRFSSIDELMMQSTGAALPLDALFAWLQGNKASTNGWSADLSRYSEGRITAQRTTPAPQADLRVILER